MQTRFYISLFILFLQTIAFAQRKVDSSQTIDPVVNLPRINLVISSRVKKIDPAPVSFQLQAWLMRLFHKEKLFIVIADSAEQMIVKVEKILKSRRAMIGNLWFDSHGHYGRRRSLFEIGMDEFNSESIKDSGHIESLRKLSPYCDESTKVGIGSCYGGATFTTPAIEHFPERRMNGDSLMIQLSKILNNATIYGSESWVMTGPGIFGSGYALAGYPYRRKFMDQFFEPVWERLGIWNRYDGKSGRLEQIQTVCLTSNGTIYEKGQSYLQLKNNRKRQQELMKELRKGKYNLAYLYQ